MDDQYWASAVEVWKGETFLPYSKHVIPLRQDIKNSDTNILASELTNLF